ncbi:MAG: ABC transporter permease, partial [Saprospiraceae bacterium]
SELNYGLIIPDNSQEKINEGKTSEITLYYKNESSSEEIILSAIRNYEIKIAKKRINNLEQNYSYINPISIERISTNNFIENINNNLGKYLPLIPVLFGFLGLIAPCTALFSSRKKGALNYAVKWDKLIGISFSGIMASFFVIMGMWLSIQFFSGHPAFMKGLMKNYLSWKNVFYLIIMILFSHLFWAGLLGYLSQKTKNTLGAFGISFFVFFIFSIFCFIFLSLDFGNISAFIPASNILAYSKSILLGNSNWFSVILSLSGCFIWGILGYFILPNSEE